MRSLRLFAMAIVCAWSTGALAQAYPSRTITFIANYPPGGAVDITARIVADKLSKIVGQSIVVENRPGGTGAIGAGAVSRADPDGYTILVTANPVITFLPALSKLPFDPIKDLTPIAKVAVAPTILIVVGNSPLRTMDDLVAAAPANKLLVGVTGVNSAPDIEIKLLGQLTRTQIATVPYSGVAPVMNDVLGGHISAGAAAIPAVMPQLADGTMRGLAVISHSRSPYLRDVPTVREALGVELDGFPTWYGFFAPPRTPPEIVSQLETGILDVMRDPAVKEKMAQLGYEIVLTGSKAFGEDNQVETERLRRSVGGS